MYDLRVIAMLLRECSEHRNTLMAAHTGDNFYFNLECVGCKHVFISACLIFHTTGPMVMVSNTLKSNECWTTGFEPDAATGKRSG